MAKGNLRMDWQSVKRFEKTLKAVHISVVRNSEQMLREMASQIMENSTAMAPFDTGTIVASRFLGDVQGAGTDEQIIHFGYAGPDTDQINPKTFKRASEYVVEVHEGFTPLQTGQPFFLLTPLTASKHEFRRKAEQLFSQTFTEARVRGR